MVIIHSFRRELASLHTRRCPCERSLRFFCNDTATTEIYTLSLHDALPIWCTSPTGQTLSASPGAPRRYSSSSTSDRKSTRLNSSHITISYAVFCLKKK